MSDSVERLKALLFDSETRTISDISQRLDSVFDRAGTAERFTESVAGVLDGALRKAEVDRHAELADAIAPLIVRTVKTEIRNSQDELVEALYPMTGRMVKAYVASALRDLANDINRRLEANPVMLRLRSLTSGKSVAELAMAESQELHVEELYLVRRGTGELVGRWPDSKEMTGRDHVMSGTLAAINEFSSQALEDEGSSLRQIDLGERQLYLRASQSYLLAAKCSGVAPAEVETVLDEAFLAALERIHQLRDASGAPAIDAQVRGELLSDVSRGLEERIGAKYAKLTARTGSSPLKLLAWIILLPLALWIFWSYYSDYRIEQARVAAMGAIEETPGLKGYPTGLRVSRLGRHITVDGLVPSADVRTEALTRIRRAVPGAVVHDQLAILPNDLGEVEPKIERVRSKLDGLEAAMAPELGRVKQSLADIEAQAKRLAVVKAMDRASRRLADVGGDLASLTAADSANQPVIDRAVANVAQSTKDLATYKAQAAGRGLDGLTELTSSFNAQTRRLMETGAELSGLIASGTNAAPAQAAGRELPSEVAESADEMAAETERLATVAVAVVQALALKRSLPAPVVRSAEPTPRERVEGWARANAIFFGNATDYRDEVRAGKVMDELTGLMRQSDVLVRVVGYTDEKGGQNRNSPLSQARAQKVVDALVARGVPAGRLVAVGRLDSRELSATIGDTSPNRRVEFEVGFDGEGEP